MPARGCYEPGALGQADAAAPAHGVGAELAGGRFEECRQLSAAGHDELVADHRQVALRRQPSVLRDAVVHVGPRDAVAVVVRPQQASRFSVQRVHENAVGRPEPGGKVDHAAGQHRAAAGRPQRDHPLVPQQLAVRLALGQAAELPDQRAPVGVETIQETVIADGVHLALPGHRGKPHGAAGEVPPPHGAGFGVQRRDRVADHRRHKHRLAQHDRLVAGVVAQSHFAGERRPRRGQLADPLQVQLRRQGLGRGGGPTRIVTKLRPVGSLTRRCRTKNWQNKQDAEGDRSAHGATPDGLMGVSPVILPYDRSPGALLNRTRRSHCRINGVAVGVNNGHRVIMAAPACNPPRPACTPARRF